MVRTSAISVAAAFWSIQALAQPLPIERVLSSPVGTTVEVTPGQEFYVQSYARKLPAYRLAKPFKGSMPGAGGLPFTFAIDTTLLEYKTRSKDGVWAIFIPEGGKFRASHFLLGSVLAPGDTVGLLVARDGRKEWFVDNSINNGMTTIWSRRVKESDPTLTLEASAKSAPIGPVDRLIYLGVSQGQVKIRHEATKIDGSVVRDEFTFPVDASGAGIGAVRGAEFTFQVGQLRARFTIARDMVNDSGSIVPDEAPRQAPPATTAI